MLCQPNLNTRRPRCTYTRSITTQQKSLFDGLPLIVNVLIKISFLIFRVSGFHACFTYDLYSGSDMRLEHQTGMITPVIEH